MKLSIGGNVCNVISEMIVLFLAFDLPASLSEIPVKIKSSENDNSTGRTGSNKNSNFSSTDYKLMMFLDPPSPYRPFQDINVTCLKVFNASEKQTDKRLYLFHLMEFDPDPVLYNLSISFSNLSVDSILITLYEKVQIEQNSSALICSSSGNISDPTNGIYYRLGLHDALTEGSEKMSKVKVLVFIMLGLTTFIVGLFVIVTLFKRKRTNYSYLAYL
ncbi:hypothetical protein HELRODRAFT_174109 [Helobdella robusta]|uniref:CUB domain-containing protein n=1 Tax=Helobdella robusta TaxID=6412 RepID=T1F7M3_HELRO|nr:hypothetical protein HELRODRAFT_174109 [Helobdella robusta]ESO03210.1 hypothetical protein HELRODRAFT_174109 [Helobdella robusta]